MNRNYDILSTALLLIAACGCFQSCQQDDFGEFTPDRDILIAQGRYLTARNADAIDEIVDPDEASWFEEGTPYRLLAFSKAYNPGQTNNEDLAMHPRFNKVAWEDASSNKLRFVNIGNDLDKWLGFKAMENETGGTNGLVSLDFYGFTYGRNESRTPDYITIEGLSGENNPEENSLYSLKHKEEVTGGELKDLMWGSILNQNIATVGQSSSDASQSIMHFTHSFSQLQFLVAQQPKDQPDADGNPVPSFEDIHIEKIEVIGTYATGYVYLQDGKVELPSGDDAKVSRQLQFNENFMMDNSVTLQQTEIGQMIVFPSDGAALKNEDKTDGYTVGLSITVKSKNKETIEQFLANTNPEGNKGTVTGNDTDGWTGTVIKESITDNYTNKTLHFKQNTAYTLIISFQKDAVRIITVIPQIEEWIPGEGSLEDPWQEQAMGQPQMFDNIVWSDRNLGSDHFDPSGENFEKTIGYFYQSGRNIPYYTFNPDISQVPDFNDKNTQNIAEKNTAWSESAYRFFPIVDPKIRKMSGNWYWTMKHSTGNPQMMIPEKMPEGDWYFDFMQGTNEWNTGLDENQDMHWEDGQQNQPTTGVWIIPSSSDFLTIFPSTPHSGNITLRNGGNNETPMNWGSNNNNRIQGTNTLRVTVPYYVENMNEPTNRSDKYREAWRTLQTNNDEGTTHIDKYYAGAPGGNNAKYEPDGDPEDGYASVYVISANPDDTKSLPDNIKDHFEIKSWGSIYAIKRIYTPKAYRMRWRVLIAKAGTRNPCLYIEICRYRCNSTDHLTEDNYKRDYDWDHPAARIYFPVCGLGDWNGQYINFGTECQYATSDPIINGKTSALQIKITGDNATNAYIAIVKEKINRNFAKQIRPILWGGVTSSE